MDNTRKLHPTSDHCTTQYMRRFGIALTQMGNSVDNDKFISHYARREAVHCSGNPVRTELTHQTDGTSMQASPILVPFRTSQKLNLSDRNLLVMSVRGDEAVVGGADHSARVVSLRAASGLSVSRTLYSKKCGHSEWVTSVTHLPEGRIATGGMDSKLCIWRGTTCKDLTDHAGSISQTAAIGENHLLSSSYDRSLKLWDLTSHSCVQSLHGHAGAVLNFVYSPVSNVLASACRLGRLANWDIATGRLLSSAQVHKGPVTAMCGRSGTKDLITVGVDGHLCIHGSTNDSQLVSKQRVFHNTPPVSISNLAVCDNSIAVTSNTGDIAVLDIRKMTEPTCIWSEDVGLKCVYSMRWVASNQLAIGTGDGHLCMRSGAGELLTRIKVDSNAIRCIEPIQAKKDVTHLLVATDDGNLVRLVGG